MALDVANIAEWLKLAVAVPAVITAYKLPAMVRWMKSKFSEMLAGAIITQLQPTLQAMTTSIEDVRKQVYPNGGGSMNDRVGQVLGTVMRVEGDVRVLQQTMRAHQDSDTTRALFEACAEGQFSWGSFALQRWCGRALDQIVGYGWINCVAHADRERVRSEWEAAVEERRDFSLRFHLHDLDGREFPVEAFAKPIRGADGTIQRWAGVINKMT